MRCLSLIAATLLLAACGTGRTGVEVRIQEVKVEVPVPCVTELPERPATLRASDLPADTRDALRIAVAALLAWQSDGGYADRAEAVMAGCAGQ